MEEENYEYSSLDKAKLMQDALISQATQDPFPEGFDYEAVRKEFINNPSISALVPDYVKRCRDLGYFWQFIKHERPTYAERRKYIWDSFAGLLDYLEAQNSNPGVDVIGETLTRFDSEHVHAIWQKALERVNRDPDGAITSAKTLLETVCKHVLENKEVSYPEKADLPKLWSLAAEELNLAPSQHNEKVFKTILGNCQAVVGAVSEIRNKISDAHGQGRKPIKPKPRHADLVVNLAGTMASFLAATWEAHKSSSP